MRNLKKFNQFKIKINESESESGRFTTEDDEHCPKCGSDDYDSLIDYCHDCGNDDDDF